MSGARLGASNGQTPASYVVKKLRTMQDRGQQLLRSQHATERAIGGVQQMKAQLVRGRGEKREREIAFLQSQAAPLVEHLVDMRDENDAEDPSAAAPGPGIREQVHGGRSASEDYAGLRAVVREAMQRGREAQEEVLAASNRLCAGTSVQRSACGGKIRVVLDASYRGARLERYAIILQRHPTECAGQSAAATHNAGDSSQSSNRPSAPVLISSSHATSLPDAEQHANDATWPDDGSIGVPAASARTLDRSEKTGGAWTVAQHSLPKFVPVAQLASRLLPANLQTFVVHVKDHVQAFAARREQWLEVLRLYACTHMPDRANTAAAGSSACARDRARIHTFESPGVRCPKSTFKISDARASDAYDQLSFTLLLAPASSSSPPERVRGGGGEAASAGGAEGGGGGGGGECMTGGGGRMRVQLVYDNLRRCAASRASVHDMSEGGDGSLFGGGSDMDVVKEAVGVLVSAGARLADKVSQIANILAAPQKGRDLESTL